MMAPPLEVAIKNLALPTNRMSVLIWAGWAAPAAAEKKPAETVTLENQLLLGKTFSYCTRLFTEKGGHESH
jgi:hypothetical protein